MQEDLRDLVVYVLVRDDLPSMNPGKAMAQVHHLGVQMMHKYHKSDLVQSYVQDGMRQGADHFNTTLVLAASLPKIYQIQDMAAGAEQDGVPIVWDQVRDPSYPFFVESMEIANLIPKTNTVKMIKQMDNGRVLMTRPEVTCSWFLGNRNCAEFKCLFDNLDLHA